MSINCHVGKPLFELGLKGYLYGTEALELALAANRLSRQYNVHIILSPQLVDIAPIAKTAKNISVFAQHLDPVTVGRGNGSILPEAVKAAGAAGVLLNHAEKRVTLNHLAVVIQRAKEVGLLTMVCADSPAEAAAIAHLRPNMIMAEPPELIGGSESVATAKLSFISEAIEAVKRIDSSIAVCAGAGIRSPEDAAAVIRAGADGTGSTSGVLCASNPAKMLEQMVMAVEEAWAENKVPNGEVTP